MDLQASAHAHVHRHGCIKDTHTHDAAPTLYSGEPPDLLRAKRVISVSG